MTAREVPGHEVDDVVDAVLRASRVLVSVAARSLAGVTDKVTLPQYRALVVLAGRGPQNAGALAEVLGVHTSTLTRLCDRLVAKGMITRNESPANRREVVLALTPRGRRLVKSVTVRRRAEIAEIVAEVPRPQRDAMVRALQAFGDAAGEATESAWLPGWSEE
ncbi:MAG TPA: MarR family transcriptional regulator [Acidimicrobiia bacterium]|jgi:DNA-binding MarR family transcriptional regulator